MTRSIPLLKKSPQNGKILPCWVRLKAQGVETLLGLIAAGEDAQRFYRHLPDAMIRDEGIWIDL